METAAKRARAGDPTNDDRLSALPDDLLRHVLSFLPSRRSVQTGVLSKRWTGLWRSVRRIDIKIDVHIRYYGNSYSKEKWEKAENFINNLLTFHDAPTLDAFRIVIGSNHKDLLPTIDGWVCRGIKQYRPADVEIAYYIHGVYKLPHLGSASTALLKKLYLFGVYLDDHFEEQLRSGCPVLEDLTLQECWTYFRDIHSSTLRKFVLRDCYRSSEMLVIRAPSLVSLTIFTLHHKNGVTLDGPMNHLVNATICPFDGGSFRSNPSRVSLLGSMFNVTNLELICVSAEAQDERIDTQNISQDHTSQQAQAAQQITLAQFSNMASFPASMATGTSSKHGKSATPLTTAGLRRGLHSDKESLLR
ncbi:hypothetical protein ACQ4PT_013426 [Festuca glaucescens]